MRLIAALLLLVVSASARATSQCLSLSAAETLVARYAAVIAQQSSDIGNASYTAAAITADGYTETSDSSNSILGIPLGSVTVPSKEAFVKLSQTDPPVVATTISVNVAGCSGIVWQWVDYSFGNAQFEIKGFHLFYTTGGLLNATYFEFNSYAGALDQGYSITLPNGTVQTK